MRVLRRTFRCAEWEREKKSCKFFLKNEKKL